MATIDQKKQIQSIRQWTDWLKYDKSSDSFTTNSYWEEEQFFYDKSFVQTGYSSGTEMTSEVIEFNDKGQKIAEIYKGDGDGVGHEGKGIYEYDDNGNMTHYLYEEYGSVGPFFKKTLDRKIEETNVYDSQNRRVEHIYNEKGEYNSDHQYEHLTYSDDGLLIEKIIPGYKKLYIYEGKKLLYCDTYELTGQDEYKFVSRKNIQVAKRPVVTKEYENDYYIKNDYSGIDIDTEIDFLYEDKVFETSRVTVHVKEEIKKHDNTTITERTGYFVQFYDDDKEIPVEDYVNEKTDYIRYMFENQNLKLNSKVTDEILFHYIREDTIVNNTHTVTYKNAESGDILSQHVKEKDDYQNLINETYTFMGMLEYEYHAEYEQYHGRSVLISEIKRDRRHGGGYKKETRAILYYED